MAKSDAEPEDGPQGFSNDIDCKFVLDKFARIIDQDGGMEEFFTSIASCSPPGYVRAPYPQDVVSISVPAAFPSEFRPKSTSTTNGPPTFDR
jgi:hypothetical protein